MNEVFEIVDHVVATPFERVLHLMESHLIPVAAGAGSAGAAIATAGAAIADAGITATAISDAGTNFADAGTAIAIAPPIPFSNYSFLATLHSINNPNPYFIQNSLGSLPYHPPRLLSPIHRYTGLSQFITLSCDNVPFDVAKLMASAAITASCKLPVLVQHGPSHHQTFYGIFSKHRFKMSFAPLSANLSFLLNLFVQRYSFGCSHCSILTGYELEFTSPVSCLSNGFTFGQAFDPVKKLCLEAIYPPACVETYIDATVDLVLSPSWNLYMTPHIDLMNLSRLFKRAIRDYGVLLSFNPFSDTSNDLVIPGAFVTESEFQKYLNTDQINSIIDQIFSSCLLSHPLNVKKSILNTPQVYQTTSLISLLRFKNSSVPKDSLLWNLACSLLDSCKPTQSLLKLETGMIPMIKVIWPRFLLELKRLWDMDLFIPGINISQNYNHENAKIDIESDHNILHQKLCMINCCMYQKTNLAPTLANRERSLEQARLRLEKQQKRLNVNLSMPIKKIPPQFNTNLTTSPNEDKIMGHYTPSLSPPSRQVSFGSSWSSDKSWSKIDSIRTRKSETRANTEQSLDPINDNDQEDIFFDALGWEEPSKCNATNSKQHEREGHAKELDMILIKAQTKMWEPITQESGYVTDDMAREQEEILEKLGTTEEARQYRSLIQSAQLVSDMEAFMAANPGAILEDFVRWHSPKDWMGNLKDGNGTLSARMSEADNLWRSLWNKCNPVPVSSQKKLFDHEKEKEKAFHDLESLTAYQVVSL